MAQRQQVFSRDGMNNECSLLVPGTEICSGNRNSKSAVGN
jgi:hypothetical protein